MTKLTDMQLILLTTACQREDGSLLPPPETLGDHKDRIRKALTGLIKRGMAEEKPDFDAAGRWRQDGDTIIGVVITKAGRAIILPPEQPQAGPATDAAPIPLTKQQQVIDLLKRDGGATLADIVSATNWLPHTSRAALTGLRKKGHAIVTSKVDGKTRYTLADAA